MSNIMVKRILYMLYCIFHRDSGKHAIYLKKNHVFKEMGDNCRYQPFFIPSDAKYITIHNNVGIGSGVEIICHDAINKLLNNMESYGKANESKLEVLWQEVEIFDNVQIGAKAIICPGVKIGPNAVISAGAVVTRDVPPDSVVAGNPAQIVGSFSVIEKMRKGVINSEGKPGTSNESFDVKQLDDVETEIIKLLERNLDGIDVANETEIIDRKLIDSLQLISIVTCLEECFNCTIPFQLINAENFNSTKRIAKLILRLRTSEPIADNTSASMSVIQGKPIELKESSAEKSVVQRIFEYALKCPNDVAVIVNEKETSYQEFTNMIYSISIWLKSIGIKQGDCVVVQAVHMVECIACYYAVHLLGGILVPVEKTAAKERISEIAHETGARLIINLEINETDIMWVSFEKIKEIEHKCLLGEPIQIEFPNLDLPCEMIFTTGTTGKSKGVLMSHRHISRYANVIAQSVEMKIGNRFLLTTPLNHAGGVRRTHLILANGCCMVYLDGLSNLGKYFEYIEKYGVTSLYLPPMAIRILLSRTGNELSKYKHQIDFVYSSSSPLPVGDCVQLRKLLPNTRLYNAYEASETPGVSVYDYNRDNFIGNCLGTANAGVEIAILQENGQITTESEIKGQICVKSEMNMLEYYHAPKLTESVIKDGWFVSSDLGWLDQEKQLHLSGRKGDVINIGGYKIAPTDVEEVALLSGLISECICIKDYDEHNVPFLKLLVVKNNESFNPKELSEFLSERLEAYKIPRKIEITDTIKKTFNGKIDRKSYRENECIQNTK